MATSESRPTLDASSRLFSAADLAEMPDELPSGVVHFELDDGRLVAMSPPGYMHAIVQAAVLSFLQSQGQAKGLGQALGEVGIVLRRNPDRVVAPDAAFVAERSLPLLRSAEGYLETVPDLVVEIASKNDAAKYLKRKTADYLEAGVRYVWIINPADRSLTLHQIGAERQFFDPERVTIPELLGDATLAVDQLFPIT